LFQDSFEAGGLLHQFATLSFLYFCIWLFLFSVVVFVAISFMSEAPSEEKVRGLTFATTVAEDKAASRATWNWIDVTLSVFVLAVILGIFLYFSPLGIAK
jgi:SSS family solute:Na+ symporter